MERARCGKRCAPRSATCCGTISLPTRRGALQGHVASFCAPVVRCVGTNHGAPCPKGFEADLTTPDLFAKLELLHLDHEQDVAITCDMWVRAIAALPHGPVWWDDGVDVGLLCHLLFGVRADPVHGEPTVESRPGTTCGAAP